MKKSSSSASKRSSSSLSSSSAAAAQNPNSQPNRTQVCAPKVDQDRGVMDILGSFSSLLASNGQFGLLLEGLNPNGSGLKLMLWKCRNSLIFEKKSVELVEAIHLLKQQRNEIEESKAIKGAPLEGMPRYVREEQMLPSC
ncbi:hypothetical protein ACFX15_012946 [Malus domestica]